jgi:hypothetical protein
VVDLSVTHAADYIVGQALGLRRPLRPPVRAVLSAAVPLRTCGARFVSAASGPTATACDRQLE